jgi:hypothetical protein
MTAFDLASRRVNWQAPDISKTSPISIFPVASDGSSAIDDDDQLGRAVLFATLAYCGSAGAADLFASVARVHRHPGFMFEHHGSNGVYILLRTPLDRDTCHWFERAYQLITGGRPSDVRFYFEADREWGKIFEARCFEAEAADPLGRRTLATKRGPR